MPELIISGITVNFPKNPYQCQVKYMEQNILALSTASNALLESPTGTGKTLCLLCSTLAWQASVMKRESVTTLAYSSGQSLFLSNPQTGVNKDQQVPKMTGNLIIYASRTHSQISQVVSELRSTVYRPRMTVLGSRDQLCIHEKISKLKGGALNHACSSLSAKRGCTHKNNLESFAGVLGDSTSSGVMDIEELVQVGREQRVCPYFYSRDMSTTSEMVLLPYNYLLDSSIRKSLKLAWQDSVIIFDEGHNLEKVASDAASCSFSSTDIARCIEELQQTLALLKEETELKRQMGGANPLAAAEEIKTQVSSGSGEGVVQKPRIGAVVEILTAVFELERMVDALPLRSNHIGSTPCIVLPGVYLHDTMLKAGLSPHKHHVDELRKCANMLMQAAEDAMGTFDGAGGGAAVMSVTVPTLMEFASAVDRVFRGERGMQYGDYKVFVSEEEIKADRSSFSSRSDHNRNSFSGGKVSHNSPVAGAKKKRVVNYWCFSPGIAMEELKALGVRSVILTSGTLSPMSALREDMKLPFPVQLENPHVIGASQMWVGALSVGPRGKQLNSAYQNRANKDYMDELGMSILHICLAMGGRGGAGMSLPPNCSIPVGEELKGGVLVFFPSYTLMDSFVLHWRASGLYDRLRNLVGAIIVEPRGTGKDNSKAADNSKGKTQTSQQQAPKQINFMASAAGKKAAPSGADDEDPEVQGVLGEFETAMKRFGGCVLMAVCRGKVSEGIDFTDNKGRVVIVTGIPFAPFKDPWVVLKKEYLDEKSRGAVLPAGVSIAMTPAPSVYSSSAYPTANGAAQHSNPYSSLGGVPITPLTPTVSAAVPSMWIGAAQNQQAAATALSSSSREADKKPPAPQHSTGYYGMPPVPLAPPTQPPVVHSYPTSYPPIPPQHVASKPSGAHNSVALTGQNWYNQSASRAVNQCLGRVIRHKKDWGAVFLLDDRFMSDAQCNQLSGWMRPSVNKFKQFSVALGGFRNFLTHAVNDKSLLADAPEPSAPPQQAITLSVHRNPVVTVTHAERRQQQHVDEEEGGVVFERRVAVPESALSSENFIDPQLLLTQNTMLSSQSGPVSKPTLNNSTVGKRLQESAVTLADTIDKMKRAGSAPHTSSLAIGDKSGKTSSGPSAFLAASSGVGAAASKGSSSFGLSALKTQNFEFSAPVDAPVKKSGSLSQLSQLSQVAKNGLAKPSQSLGQSSQSTQSQQNGGSSNAVDLKSLVGELRKSLTPEQMSALRALLVSAKPTGLQMISQVKHFVDSVVSLLSGLEGPARLSAMLQLARLLPAHLEDTYRSLAKQACVNLLQQKKLQAPLQSETVKAESGSLAVKQQVRVKEEHGRIENLDVLARSSKRAKTLASLSQQGGSSTSASSGQILGSLKRPDFLSQLNAVPAMELSGKAAASRLTVKSQLPSGTHKLVCGICKEAPTTPCANKCGHVCCERCWELWLRKTESCPFCRQPASKLSVTRLVIKSSS